MIIPVNTIISVYGAATRALYYKIYHVRTVFQE
jgi:hypothetical protein